MRKSPLQLIIVLLLGVLGVFLIVPRTPLKSLSVVPDIIVESASFTFSKFGYFRKVAGNFVAWRSLSSENEELKLKNKELTSRLARLDILEEENSFLKRAVGIREKMGDIVYANVYNLNLGPKGYNVMINKGSSSGITEGDVVVTGGKELVGIVESVSENFSRLNFIFDTDFKITAKVLGKDTAGIARGAVTEGMYLDLISKDDDISEGDIMISSGNDMFPPALIVGKVVYVESSDTQTFKKVRVMPEIDDLGKVVVLVKSR